MNSRIRVARTNNLQDVVGENLNIVLAKGQPFYDSATKMFYIGDGVSTIEQIKADSTLGITSSNVKDKINGKLISEIFETDGTTTKKSSTLEGKLFDTDKQYSIKPEKVSIGGTLKDTLKIKLSDSSTISIADDVMEIGNYNESSPYPVAKGNTIINGKVKVVNEKEDPVYILNDLQVNGEINGTVTNAKNCVVQTTGNYSKLSAKASGLEYDSYIDGNGNFVNGGYKANCPNREIINTSIHYLYYGDTITKTFNREITLEELKNAHMNILVSDKLDVIKKSYDVCFEDLHIFETGGGVLQFNETYILEKGIEFKKNTLNITLKYNETNTKLTGLDISATHDTTYFNIDNNGKVSRRTDTNLVVKLYAIYLKPYKYNV